MYLQLITMQRNSVVYVCIYLFLFTDGHQLATIPITMTAPTSTSIPGGAITNHTTANNNSSGNMICSQGRSKSSRISKTQVKDLSTKGNKAITTRTQSPKAEITIKEEMFD